MSNKQESKYGSRKFIIVLWAIGLLSFVAIYGLIKNSNPTWLSILVPILGTIILTYFGVDAYLKNKYISATPIINPSDEEEGK